MKNYSSIPIGSGSLSRGKIICDPSTRVDQKRDRQWSVDAPEPELFFNKKQAVKFVNDGATSEAAIVRDYFRSDISSSPHYGGQIGDHLFISKPPIQISNVSGKNVSSNVPVDLNTENGYKDRYGNGSSICLSKSHSLEDPLRSNTGIRRVKATEARIPEICLPKFMGNLFPGDKNELLTTTFQATNNGVSSYLTYNTSDGNTVLLNPAFRKHSVGQDSSERDRNYSLSNQYYNWMDHNVLPIGQAFNRGYGHFISTAEQYQRENGNIMLLGPTYNVINGKFCAVNPFYNQNNGFISAHSSSNKIGDAVTSMTAYNGQPDAPVVSLGTLRSEGNYGLLSLSSNHNNGEQTSKSVGGLQCNPEESDFPGRVPRSIYISENQFSGTSEQKNSPEQKSLDFISSVKSKTEDAHKNKERKATRKASMNFPANVKSLLATGILDGVPVKYVSWSREKNLRGVVSGSAYLCGCKECKLSKAVNAYVFENHAGCKTKHPNNHIYFENGKTIYSVVLDLKNTPQEMLFDVIQTVTGSPVNQKNLDIWKASYEDTTRKLPQVYEKDDTNVPS